MADATGKVVRWRRRLSEFDFQVFQRTGIRHHAADIISRLSSIRMDESLLEEDVPVLTITDTKPEREKPKHTQNIWHSLPCKDGKQTVKHALPEILHVSDGTDKERSLTTSEFVTGQMNAPSCRKICNKFPYSRVIPLFRCRQAGIHLFTRLEWSFDQDRPKLMVHGLRSYQTSLRTRIIHLT